MQESLPAGIRTKNGRVHDVDVIVFATGFNVADTDDYVRVVGRHGHILTEDWERDGSEAYLGVNVAGYPNLALILGPNSGLGHSSALHVMESQARYILQYVARIGRDGTAWIDVRPDVQRRYNARLQSRLATTVWASGCSSWYLNRTGKNTTIYPGITSDYRRATARLDPNDYLHHTQA
jgi:cation diffusion facilitator CzcD-associated flavoprotein CzcO